MHLLMSVPYTQYEWTDFVYMQDRMVLGYCNMKERIHLEEIMHVSHKEYSVSHSIPTELYIWLGRFSS